MCVGREMKKGKRVLEIEKEEGVCWKEKEGWEV